MSFAPRRTDRGSRLIKASPAAIYSAYLDRQAVAIWRPPAGMTAEVAEFDPRAGGGYRMAFLYPDDGHQGKTTANADFFSGSFLELVPERRIVEVVEFDSEDAELKGEMTIVTSLEWQEESRATLVSVECRDVPPGIGEGDHLEGIASSLSNLARYLETRPGTPGEL